MAQIANLSLLDGQATPVAKVFSPTTAALDQSSWMDRSFGRLIGVPIVKLKSILPGKSSAHFKVSAEIHLPVLETITNANASGYAAPPSVAYTVKGLVTFIMPARSALQERKDITAYMSNLLKDAQFLALTQNFEMPY